MKLLQYEFPFHLITTKKRNHNLSLVWDGEGRATPKLVVVRNNMNRTKLKIFALAIGAISLPLSAFEVLVLKGFFEFYYINFTEIIKANILFSYLLFSPLSSIGLFISSFGLYHSKSWAYFFANFCLIVFLGGIFITAISYLSPNLLDLSANLNSGKGMAYLPSIDFKVYLTLFMGIALLTVLNLKSTRLLFGL